MLHILPSRIPLASVKPGIVPHGVNLFQHRGLPDDVARSEWKKTLEVVSKMPFASSPGRKASASEAEVTLIHRGLQRHPLILDANKHVPGGACFWKGFVTHLHLLRLGYDKDAILGAVKIWDAKSSISHHVARLLRADDGEWWVLDMLDSKPKKLERWGWPGTYVVEANRWGPMGQWAEPYNPSHFHLVKEDGTLDRSVKLYGDGIGRIARYFKNTTRADAEALMKFDDDVPKAPKAGPVNADQQTLDAMQLDAQRYGNRFEGT